jgi:hypothetical protein
LQNIIRGSKEGSKKKKRKGHKWKERELIIGNYGAGKAEEVASQEELRVAHSSRDY